MLNEDAVNRKASSIFMLIYFADPVKPSLFFFNSRKSEIQKCSQKVEEKKSMLQAAVYIVCTLYTLLK